MAELVLLWAAIGAYFNQARKVDRAAAALVLPYLGWVTFAAFLNEEVVRRNPGAGGQLIEPSAARAGVPVQ